MTKIYTQEELAGLDGLIGNIKDRVARIEAIEPTPGAYVLGYQSYSLFIKFDGRKPASTGLEGATVRFTRTGWPPAYNGANERAVVYPLSHAKARALKSANEALDLLVAARNNAVLGEVAA